MATVIAAMSGDEDVNPMDFVPGLARPKDDGVAYVGPKKKREAVDPLAGKSDRYKQILAAMKQLRPDFSCDHQSMSEAWLSELLSIEQSKHQNHYPVGTAPPPVAATSPQNGVNAQILAGINAIAGELKKLNRRVTKLEKSNG
jgi:hypothetical protein